MRLLIKNGYVLNPADGLEGVYDILIEDDKIEEISPKIHTDADKIIQADGYYVMPGFIDLHVHFREPGFEKKETIATGSLAAAAGGYTTVCPMPNTNPVIDSKELVEFLKQKEKEESVVHIIPVGAVTKGQLGKELADIKGMADSGALAVSEDGKSVMDILLYREGMKEAAKAGLVVMAHCEDKTLVNGGVMNEGKRAKELGMPGITNSVEDVIAARDIILAKETKAKLHLCHCSTADSVALVKLAKEWNLPVTAEVCPHHFAMSEDDIPYDCADYKMNPPLRSIADVRALKEGLRDNIMDIISTDHAPHCAEEKAQSMKKAPFGIVGLETAFALTITHLVKTGYLTLMQMVEKMSLNPAKVLGIDKGQIAKGKIADLVIANPNREYTIDKTKFFSKGVNTPFDGQKVYGKVIYTIVDGKVVYQEQPE